MSKQAWGAEATGTSTEVRVASWEIGVLVWPSLLTGKSDAEMVGTFQTDTPSTEKTSSKAVVGLRIPYSLPLQAYGEGEVPWVATMGYDEPDNRGSVWPGW